MRSVLAIIALAGVALAAANETSVAARNTTVGLNGKIAHVGDVCGDVMSIFIPCKGWTYPYCGSGFCGASGVSYIRPQLTPRTGGEGASCETDADCIDSCVVTYIGGPEAECIVDMKCGKTPQVCGSDASKIAKRSRVIAGRTVARWR